MQYRLKLASCAFALVSVSAVAAACGHLPFDELPEIPDGSTDANAPVLDGSNPTDAPVASDGNVDAQPERDAGQDARFVIDGAPDASCGLTGDCNVIYVSAAIGNNDNPGTSDRPVADFVTALDLVSSKRNEIHVAAGDYKGPVKITGENDVRIFGGFQCSSDSCTWGKSDKETVVTASDLGGGALFVGAGHTRKTIINTIHFTGAQGVVDSGNTVGAVTVLLSSSTPTLQALTIDGPSSKGGSVNTGRRSAALMIRGKQDDPNGALIDGCTITGGTADLVAAGILVEDGPSALPISAQPVIELVRSTVIGGTAPATSAILLSTSGPNTKIHENVKIQAAVASTQGSVADSWAITASGAVDISRNFINPSTATGDYCKTTTICGGIHLINATATVRNNIVHGLSAPASAAVLLEMSDGGHPTVILNANVLEGGGSGGQEGFSAGIFVKNKNQSDGTIGLVRNNIILGGKNKFPYGIYELENNTVQGHVAALDHNDIRAESALYRAWIFPSAASPQAKNYDVNTLGTAPFLSATDANTNISADCFGSNTNFHLAQHAPCINAGTNINAPVDDIDGDPRPFPAGNPGNFDIGADESPFSSP